MLKIRQNILKNTRGVKTIINLIVTLLPGLEIIDDNMSDISPYNHGLNDDYQENMEHCTEIVSMSYSILRLYCENNPENQKSIKLYF